MVSVIILTLLATVFTVVGLGETRPGVVVGGLLLAVLLILTVPVDLLF